MKMIKKSKVKINFNNQFEKKYVNNFDKIIVTTYANNNLVLKN